MYHKNFLVIEDLIKIYRGKHRQGWPPANAFPSHFSRSYHFLTPRVIDFLNMDSVPRTWPRVLILIQGQL